MNLTPSRLFPKELRHSLNGEIVCLCVFAYMQRPVSLAVCICEWDCLNSIVFTDWSPVPSVMSSPQVQKCVHMCRAPMCICFNGELSKMPGLYEESFFPRPLTWFSGPYDPSPPSLPKKIGRTTLLTWWKGNSNCREVIVTGLWSPCAALGLGIWKMQPETLWSSRALVYIPWKDSSSRANHVLPNEGCVSEMCSSTCVERDCFVYQTSMCWICTRQIFVSALLELWEVAMCLTHYVYVCMYMCMWDSWRKGKGRYEVGVRQLVGAGVTLCVCAHVCV